ncbi:MAG: hypothetical protein ACE5R6_14345, partial [Candidatus Heimdallarchaeota archaeon]
MKKQMGFITSLCVILLVFTSASNPALAATTIEELGHSWDNAYLAIVADVNQPKDESIHLVADLTPETAHTITPQPDINAAINNQFFFSYINQSGMEVGYLALERLAKTTFIQYNRTAPFQALFTHFTNDAGTDVFVVVNFDGLLAYSGGGRHRGVLDPDDEIFLGLTFGGQGLADLLSAFLVNNGLEPLPHWNVTPFFEYNETDGSFSFGMTYHNLLVSWLSLTSENQDYDKLGQELAGPQLRAISLFDNVTFRYDLSFETDASGLTMARIAANYDFGSTDIIAIGYQNDPEVDDREEKAKTRLEKVRDDKKLTGEVKNIELTPNNLEEHSAVMIYTDDLAKLRIHGPLDETPGFGLAVVNSAIIITVGDYIIEKDGKALDPTTAGDVGSVTMVVDGKKTFESDYKTKGDYSIVWANGTSREDIPVFNTIIPAGRRGFNAPYFILQRLILAPWLLGIAKDLRKQQTTTEQVTVEHYFIASMFPFWSG